MFIYILATLHEEWLNNQSNVNFIGGFYILGC